MFFLWVEVTQAVGNIKVWNDLISLSQFNTNKTLNCESEIKLFMKRDWKWESELATWFYSHIYVHAWKLVTQWIFLISSKITQFLTRHYYGTRIYVLCQRSRTIFHWIILFNLQIFIFSHLLLNYPVITHAKYFPCSHLSWHTTALKIVMIMLNIWCKQK